MVLMWNRLGRPTKYTFAAIFVMMAVVIFVVINKERGISESNLVSLCDKVNAVVAESNHRIPSHKADKEGLVKFLRAARETRNVRYEAQHEPSDRLAVRKYTEIIKFVESHVSFDKITPLNCTKVVN